MEEDKERSGVTAGEIRRRLRFRACLSIAGIAALGAIGLVGMAITADHVDLWRAGFDVGLALCVCSFTLIIGWGASSNHALAVELIDERLTTVERIERETGNAVVVALDDLRTARERRAQHKRGG